MGIGNKIVIVRNISLYNGIIRVTVFMRFTFRVLGTVKNQCVVFGFSKGFDMTKQNLSDLSIFTDSGENRLY